MSSTFSGPNALTITLSIETRYAPHFYPGRCAELKEVIRKGLTRANPVFAARVAQEAVDLRVELVPAGTLGDARVLEA